MIRRPVLLSLVLLGATALPAAPALAGEDDGDNGRASLRAPQDCVNAKRAKAVVTGDDIDRVAFFVDGKRVKALSQPNSGDSYVLSMACARVSVGTHSASAVVRFSEGSTQTLRFQITRVAQVSPRYTG